MNITISLPVSSSQIIALQGMDHQESQIIATAESPWISPAFSAASCYTIQWGLMSNGSPSQTMSLPIVSHNSFPMTTHCLTFSLFYRNFHSCGTAGAPPKCSASLLHMDALVLAVSPQSKGTKPTKTYLILQKHFLAFCHKYHIRDLCLQIPPPQHRLLPCLISSTSSRAIL